ncbi:PREDICTED: uncharacterized protein LOC108773969 [Cyphomyrmex costatus]|uniref:uncharacterized protein LOC108773969 n=1 Tax=Cyphomyrmex costatus TaxID=456900 RepID=UPI0008522B19|nr:PREDICTED: uncharacterized protein LOC108773969 [Cyphomyrmex costatus]
MKYSRVQKRKKWDATSLDDESCSRCGKCLTKMQLVLLSALFCSSLTTGAGLEIRKLDVPSIADPRWEMVSLRCEYDLGGKELYSVTWNKDGQEIFRFMPGSPTPKRPQNISGLYIDLNRSDHKQVTLLGPNTGKGKVDLAGSYGCEVSSEAPSFETDYREANMSVAVPPQSPPILEGMRPSYEVGQILQVECTSGLSYPPAVLTFILNGKEVNRALTKDLHGVGNIDGNLVSTTRLGLTMRLERHHFSGGSLTLMCQSTLPGIAHDQPLNVIEIATLAASNQRLAQEPPKSGSESNVEFYPILTYWTMTVIHVIRYNSLRFLRV